MSIERKVRKLNTLLRTELGSNPPYAWVHTRSPLLHHPMEDHSTGLDYLCSCGRNVRIHSASCGSLVAAVQPIKLVWAFPFHPNHWVLCKTHAVNRKSWMERYGKDAHYVSEAAWPHEVSGIFIPHFPPHFIGLDAPPTEDQTWAVIELIRAWESRSPSEWMEMILAIQDKREREADQKLEGALNEAIGIRPWAGHPGFGKTSMSFPEVRLGSRGTLQSD